MFQFSKFQVLIEMFLLTGLTFLDIRVSQALTGLTFLDISVYQA